MKTILIIIAAITVIRVAAPFIFLIVSAALTLFLKVIPYKKESK